MLSGRKKKDYAAESSADAIDAVAGGDGSTADADAAAVPADEPLVEELAA
jgi:hypothetical protein